MIRRTNAFLALLIALFFCTHEVLGALYAHNLIDDGAAWLIWADIAAMTVHAALCIATTKQMIDDEQHPPSRKKKGHQAKKWATGIAVGLLVVVHVCAPYAEAAWTATTILLAASLAVHVCVSSKSLVKDLGIPSDYRFVPRAFIVAITLSCAIGVAFI